MPLAHQISVKRLVIFSNKIDQIERRRGAGTRRDGTTGFVVELIGSMGGEYACYDGIGVGSVGRGRDGIGPIEVRERMRRVVGDTSEISRSIRPPRVRPSCASRIIITSDEGVVDSGIFSISGRGTVAARSVERSVIKKDW